MKSIFLISSLLSFIFIHAQKAKISASNAVTVYIGLQNPIDITYPGVAVNDLVIKENMNCEITKNGEDYFLKPLPYTNSCSYIRGVKEDQSIKWLDTTILPVKDIPKGEVRLGELSSGNYNLQEILEQTKLTYNTDAYIKDFDKNINFPQYRIILIPKEGPMEYINHIGSLISQQAKELIGRLKVGDLIVIDEIKIKIYDREFFLIGIIITVDGEYHPESSSVEPYQGMTYKLESLNDSLHSYELYFPDGRIYMQGKVLTETKFRKYSYSISDGKEPYEKHLLNINKDYYPIGGWDVFDSAGHHMMTLNFMAVQDTVFIHSNDVKLTSNTNHYRIVPDGQCIFYKSDGIIEKIIYYKRGTRR